MTVGSLNFFSSLGDHFPIEARHHLAPWLEQNFTTELDLTNPQVTLTNPQGALTKSRVTLTNHQAALTNPQGTLTNPPETHINAYSSQEVHILINLQFFHPLLRLCFVNTLINSWNTRLP